MPPEAPPAPVSERVAELNHRFRNHGALSVLGNALSDPLVGRTALVSSFGVESVALLHMVSILDRTTPVLFLDTGMHFPETLAYRREIRERLRLADVRTVRPDRERIFLRDPDGILHLSDPDACCELRKTEPLQAALRPFDAWITGRKRYQGGARGKLELFESDGQGRVKINPLAFWDRGDIRDYIDRNALPLHPLASRGYASVGCQPCTDVANAGEDDRAGRWRGLEKTECGIHFTGGAFERGGAA